MHPERRIPKEFIPLILSIFLLIALSAPQLVNAFDELFPNDPEFTEQWNLHGTGEHGTDWIAAYERLQQHADILDLQPVTVAVLDSGIDTDNPDLQESINFDLSCSVIDTQKPCGDIEETTGHGTGVAGQIVGETNNEYAVAGSLPISDSLVMIKFYGKNGPYINYSDLYAALQYLNTISTTVSVANISMEGNPDVSGNLIMRINELITQMTERQQVIFVASTGNQNENRVAYPALLPEVIAVGSSDETGGRAFFSNYGEALDILAPGTNVVGLSHILESDIRYGTSSSAPQVTQAVVLIKAFRPNATFSEVSALLQAASGEEWTPERGHGILNFTLLLDLLGVPTFIHPTPSATSTETLTPAPTGTPTPTSGSAPTEAATSTATATLQANLTPDHTPTVPSTTPTAVLNFLPLVSR
jgi:subtilisin family serine protease